MSQKVEPKKKKERERENWKLKEKQRKSEEQCNTKRQAFQKRQRRGNRGEKALTI